MIFIKCNSGRARHLVTSEFPDAVSYYHMPTLFTHTNKGIYLVDATTRPNIKGVTKCRDQDRDNYGTCW